MKQQSKTSLNRYNKAVAAAFQRTLIDTKALLKHIPTDFVRSYFERRGIPNPEQVIVHEIISPLIYLRLTLEPNGTYAIRFGIEPTGDNSLLNSITIQFLRALMRHTCSTDARINIEQCIMADWFMNCCSELFDYIDNYNKNHEYVTIPYEPVQVPELVK